MTKYATMAKMFTAMRTRKTRRSDLSGQTLLREKKANSTLATKKEIQLMLSALEPDCSSPATCENELEKNALRLFSALLGLEVVEILFC